MGFTVFWPPSVFTENKFLHKSQVSKFQEQCFVIVIFILIYLVYLNLYIYLC